MKVTFSAAPSKFARRVLSIFFLAVLLPIGAASLIAYKHVESSLTEQAYEQLRNASKFYGLAVFDRLSAAQQRLSRLAEGPKAVDALPESLATLLGHEMSEVVVMSPSGVVIDPTGRSASDSWESLVRGATLSKERSTILSSVRQGPSGEVIVAVPLDSSVAGGGWILGRLNGDYLWGKAETRPFGFEFCVFELQRTLFCTPTLERRLPEDLAQRQADAVSARLRWRAHDQGYLAVHRELFLPVRFDATAWTVIAAQAEPDAYRSISAFRRSFPLVVATSVLCVILLVAAQVRRRVAPLGRLIEGTRRLANKDFDTQITVTSGDELEELAAAFNDMASRLGDKFRTLAAMSEIDALILSAPDVEQVVIGILQRASQFVPADVAAVTLLDRDSPSFGLAFVRDLRRSGPVGRERIQLEGQELEVPAGSAGDARSWPDTQIPSLLQKVTRTTLRCAVSFPLVFEGRTLGELYFGVRECIVLSDEGTEQARTLAGRLTVALSAVERREQLYRQAHYDALTGLPNRELFRDRLVHELSHAKREGYRIAVLFIDLDRFKKVNDALGHASGDELLRQAASRLLKNVRESDTVARISGDEFAIALSMIDGPKAAGAHAEKVIRELSRPFVIDQQEFFISASVGVALYPNDGDSFEGLLRNADTAMYRAKEEGRGRHLFFQDRMNIEVVERAALERDLRLALMRDEFTLFYQPQVDATDGTIVAAEVLLRWFHPVRGEVPPNRFVPIAEDTGMIEEIGAWVLEQACAQLARWQAEQLPLHRVAVNVSPRQFSQTGIAELVEGTVERAGIPPAGLELEVTESLLIEDLFGAKNILGRLKDFGVRVSIDDFGTGYSSLSYLHRFPVDALKVDRSFVMQLGVSRDAMAIINAIIALARTLDKVVLAEGVENEAQWRALAEHGCDLLQGYHFARPMSAQQLTAVLRHSTQRKVVRCD